jgi:hypothetical protein
MNAHRYLTGMMAVLLFGSVIANGQKKPAAPAAPAKPAAAAAKPAAGPAKSGAPAASHAGSPSTAGKSGPTTAGGARGPTTAGGAKSGPSTAGGRTGAASTAGHPATAGGHTGAANTAGHPAAASTGGRPGAAGGKAGGPSAANHSAGKAPNGSHMAHAANGSSVRTRANGSRADVHDSKRGMDIHHGLNGNRRVASERADHSRVVSERGGRGYYQQRPYGYRGHEYARRSYYDHGRAYDRYYNRYSYHGMFVYGYAPGFYYAPAFYGWAYNPWVTPVPYAWGFVAAPWYGYYGAYFTPYPVYPSASLWLTDYIISQSLAANYAAAQAAQQQAALPPDAAPMTPDIKALVAEEVKRQLALSNQEAQTTAANNVPDPASSGIARMMSDNIQHVFVAGADLDLVDATGTECAVSEGDALQLTGPPAADATAANLVVLSSKGGVECHKGATVSVALTDLQDMQNHMRETIDAGMGDLQQKGGTGGLPAVPASAKAAPAKAAFVDIAPPPDPNAAAEVAKQATEADKAELEVTGAVTGDSGPSAAAAAPAAPPAAVTLGQTIDQVTTIWGQPKSVVDLGAKKIYVYKDVKVTFTGGKVTDVQ